MSPGTTRQVRRRSRPQASHRRALGYPPRGRSRARRAGPRQEAPPMPASGRPGGRRFLGVRWLGRPRCRRRGPRLGEVLWRFWPLVRERRLGVFEDDRAWGSRPHSFGILDGGRGGDLSGRDLGSGRGFRGRRANRGRLGRLVAQGGRLGSGLAVRRRLGHRGAVGGRDRSGIVVAAMPGVRGAVSRRLLHVGRTVVSRFLCRAAVRGGFLRGRRYPVRSRLGELHVVTVGGTVLVVGTVLLRGTRRHWRSRR